MRPILPLSEPKCTTTECTARHKCARHEVEYAQGRPMQDFHTTTNVNGLWCLKYLPLDYAAPKQEKKPHEPIKGIC